MTTAREIMTQGADCAQTTDTVTQAAQKMKALGVGALPICGEDNQLHGVITDQDIVTNCVAGGADTRSVTVADYAGDKPVTIGADDDADVAVSTMIESGVRRLPVIDGTSLVGMLSQADLAAHLSAEQSGRLLGSVSTAPTNN